MPHAEANIGLVGHVDHGKCIPESESILVNCALVTGTDLIRAAESTGRVLDAENGERTYEIPGLHTYSLDENLALRRSKAYLFVQDYNGKLIHIRTKTGRQISVTQRHPLLANRGGRLEWVPAKDLTRSDFIAVLGSFDAPHSPHLAKDFLGALEKDYYVLDQRAYEGLKAETEGFRRLDNLSPEDLNKLRLLTGLSQRQISQALGCSCEHINDIFKGDRHLNGRIGKALMKLLYDSVAGRRIDKGEFMLGDRNKSRYIYRLRDVELDADLARWFAFVHAEGTSNSTSITVAQKTYPCLLDSFFEISKEKFGLGFKKTGPITYQASSKPVVSYLRAKFGFKTGASRESPICPWVLGLRVGEKAAFLRWFFTLEAEFSRSGEIVLTQANRDNINIINFLLLSFGIVPKLGSCRKCATNVSKPKKRVYYRLTVSGKRDLRSFLDKIGLEDEKKAHIIENYLRRIKAESKSDNFLIPVQFSELFELLDKIGLKRGKLRSSRVMDLGRRPWYKSYEDCRYKNAMSVRKFREMMADIEAHLAALRKQLPRLEALDDLPLAMELFGVSHEELSAVLPLSQTEVSRLLRGARKHHRNDNLLVDGLRRICESRLAYVEEKLNQWRPLCSESILFDRIAEISSVDYKGRLVDLSVPPYANFIAGFGGVVSHNTSLTKALTGVWTDRHSEEIRRGISIRLGYADTSIYKCEKCEGVSGYTTQPKCKCGEKAKFLRKVSFVDSPGHETLIATMLSGSALMDGVILVIAADETCPQPQTKEHLLALKIMGLKNIIVVQNKIDVVDAEAAKKNRDEIVAFLKKMGIEAPIIPIAANYGANIDVLIAAMQEIIPTPKRDTTKQAKMYVARSFDVNKPGATVKDLKGGVLGGSLMQGELKVGDEVEIKPGIKKVRQNQESWVSLKTKVVEIDEGSEKFDSVGPGGLIAVRTGLDPYLTKSDALSGNVLGKVGTLPEPLKTIDATIHMIERELIGEVDIKPSEPLMLSIGTTVTVGLIQKQKGDQLTLGLKIPIVAQKGDRFAISKRIDMKFRLIGYGEIL